jgi:hypothetical protein
VALDDYHVIDEAAVHAALTFLLENLPPQVTLAMSTRADPPLPLSRLRARGELVEVRAADLRFTTEEAEVFLNEVMGLQLEPALVAALEARTEGWAAGLQLAALSARTRAGAADGSGDVAGFVDAFSGSHRFVLDYLVEEVLDGQPELVRAFLLDTSVLDQMTGGLCDALTGRSDGQSTLEILERGNVFVVALDDERRWYRYHHLFADALRARLAGGHPDRVGELHAAASRWLAGNGLLGDAVRHAIASGDNEREPARERELAAGRGRDGDDEDGEQRDLDRVGVVQDDEQCAGERGAPVLPDMAGSGLLLRRWRVQPELRVQRRHVPVVAVAADPPVLDLERGCSLDRERFAGCGHAGEIALVGAGHGPFEHCPVAGDDLGAEFDLKIGERVEDLLSEGAQLFFAVVDDAERNVFVEALVGAEGYHPLDVLGGPSGGPFVERALQIDGCHGRASVIQ